MTSKPTKTSHILGVIMFAMGVFPMMEASAAPGDLDLTFGGTGVVSLGFEELFGSTANAVTVQKDGKIVAAGEAFEFEDDFVVARFLPNGMPDPTFNGTGRVKIDIGVSPVTDDSAQCVVIQGNGKIVVAGGCESGFGVLRFNANGTLDTTFNGSGKATVPVGSFAACRGLALQADGKILVAGTCDETPAKDILMVRFNANGSLDTGFAAGGKLATGIVPLGQGAFGPTANLALQPDGRILLCSNDADIDPEQFDTDVVVARYLPSGAPDLSFNGTGRVLTDAGGDDCAYDMAIQPDGKILVGGWGGTLGSFVLRYQKNGSLDTSFNGTGIATTEFEADSSSTSPAFALTLQTNGKIVIVGATAFQTSEVKLGYARFTKDGILDSTFANGGRGVADMGYGLDTVIQSDGKILIASGGVARFEGDAPAPEIFVEQPLGTPLEDGSSQVDFGEVEAGKSVSKSVTIKNIGNLVMTGIAATLDGLDAGEFAIQAQPPTTLASFTGSTTIVVRFTPSVVGSKTAVLRISSDDPDEQSFDIDLSADALPVVAFGEAIFRRNEEAGTISIPVVRTPGAAGECRVTLSTSNGGAASPSDFTAVVNEQVVIGVGVNQVDVPITLHNPANTAEVNEAFTVKLSNPVGAALGTPSTATVVILDSEDTTKPGTPVFTAPLSGAFVGVEPAGTVTIQGTASDNQKVERVEVSLDGINFVPATVTPTGSGSAYGTTATFTASLTPTTGPNTVRARTVDRVPNVSQAMAVRSFVVTRKLVVNAEPALGSVTNGFHPHSFREVGKSHTITATPKAGALFTGWTVSGAANAQIGIADSARQKQTLTFIFREGLELTANFVESPYDGVDDSVVVAGTYTGLVKASPDFPERDDPAPDGTVPGAATEGYLTVTAMNTGAFSGKLTIDGLVLNVAGVFDEQGRARFGSARTETLAVARVNKPSLTVKLDIGGVPNSVAPDGKITGEVSATEFRKSVLASVSTVGADRAPFTGLAGGMVPDAYLTVAGTTRSDGVFTVVLPPVPLASQPDRIRDALTEDDYPKGTGVGTIKVSKAGAVTLTATLADGTAMTASGKLSSDLRVALFAPLYSLKGFFSAELKLDDSQTNSDVSPAADSEVLWSRPFNSTAHYYPFGWAETIEVGLIGAKYGVTANQSVLKRANGVSLADADADGNVRLTFQDGKLETPGMVKSANLSKTDVVTKVPDNDPTFTMVVNRTTGMVTGMFLHTDDTKPNYNAVILQKGPNAGAHGFFLTKQPVPIDYTGRSGKVEVMGEP